MQSHVASGSGGVQSEETEGTEPEIIDKDSLTQPNLEKKSSLSPVVDSDDDDILVQELLWHQVARTRVETAAVDVEHHGKKAGLEL